MTLPRRTSAPGARAWRVSRRGITVIELAVVMFVALALATSAFVAVSAIFRADLKSDTHRIAAAVRYLYNLSVINGRPYRLVLDVEGGRFWGEEMEPATTACDAFLLDTGEGEVAAKQESKRKSRERGEAEARSGSGGSFSKFKDNELSERKLSAGVRIRGVISEANRENTTSGTTYVHFFPSGYVEHAFIYVGEDNEFDDEETKIFTIETRPLQGGAEVVREKIRERDFDG